MHTEFPTDAAQLYQYEIILKWAPHIKSPDQALQAANQLRICARQFS
jgi:hypothetical protein